MPVTNDWNIAYPSPLDPGNFAAQMAALAQSTDNALTVVNDTATDGNTLYFLNQTERDAYPTANLKVGQECHIQGSNERYRWDGSNWLHTNVFYNWTAGTGANQWNPGHMTNFEYAPHSSISRSGNWVTLQLWAKRTGRSWGTHSAFDWQVPSWALPLNTYWMPGNNVSYPDRSARFSLKMDGSLRWERQNIPINTNQVVLCQFTYLAHNAVKI